MKNKNKLLKLVTSPLFFIHFFIYLFGLVYLTAPLSLSFDLPNSLKSQEPGDTWQNPGQSAFFTNQSRQEVLNWYQANNTVKLFGYSFPNYRLNYRPEDTSIYIRDQIRSYFLEEIVVPFRGSIFVNGWYPQLSPLNAHMSQEELAKQTIQVDNEVFSGKITIKPYFSTSYISVFIWTICMTSIYFSIMLFNLIKKSK